MDESRKIETLDNLSGMKWKRNPNHEPFPHSNADKKSPTAERHNENDTLHQRIKNLRIEVLVHDSWYYNEESASSASYDCSGHSHEDTCSNTRSSATEEPFFRNIDPKDDKAFQFYKAEKIAAVRNEEPRKDCQLTPTSNISVGANVIRKPWLRLPNFKLCHAEFPIEQTNSDCRSSYPLVSDSVDETATRDVFYTCSGGIAEQSDLNPNVPAFVPCSDESNVTGGDVIFEATAKPFLQQQQQEACIVTEITKRRPGVRLNCKRLETAHTDELAPSSYNIFTNSQNGMNRDIGKLLDQIDAERLNNLSRQLDRDNNSFEEAKIIDQFETTCLNNPDKSCNERNSLQETNANSKEVCFSSSTVCTIPTAMVQPSVNFCQVPTNFPSISKSSVNCQMPSSFSNTAESQLPEKRVNQISANQRTPMSHNDNHMAENRNPPYIPNRGRIDPKISILCPSAAGTVPPVSEIPSVPKYKTSTNYQIRDNNENTLQNTSIPVACEQLNIPANYQTPPPPVNFQMPFIYDEIRSHQNSVCQTSLLPSRSACNDQTLQNISVAYSNKQDDLCTGVPIQNQLPVMYTRNTDDTLPEQHEYIKNTRDPNQFVASQSTGFCRAFPNKGIMMREENPTTFSEQPKFKDIRNDVGLQMKNDFPLQSIVFEEEPLLLRHCSNANDDLFPRNIIMNRVVSFPGNNC